MHKLLLPHISRFGKAHNILGLAYDSCNEQIMFRGLEMENHSMSYFELMIIILEIKLSLDMILCFFKVIL
jgi:hypothetical protein